MSHFVIIHLNIQTGALHFIAVDTCTHVFFGHISLIWLQKSQINYFYANYLVRLFVA